MTPEIIVFRYGHREIRDYRVTSHCALVARALGAKKIIICGKNDEGIKASIDAVTKRWGGPFKVEFAESWRQEMKKIKKRGFVIVHLTMYGKEVEKEQEKIGKMKKICIIIGSQKVERGVYDLADYNISVTQQPHSEIAALAVFMDRIQQGKELSKKFKGAKRRIEPLINGKRVIALK